jgi:formylglycine-generating enzyme required for sulfatase activity
LLGFKQTTESSFIALTVFASNNSPQLHPLVFLELAMNSLLSCGRLLFCLLVVATLYQSCHGQEVKQISNSIGMKLVLLPKGTFTMGSPEALGLRGVDEVEHEVTISKEFYLGLTEVTQSQYAKIMGVNPSNFKGEKEGDRADYPVENVSWDAAVEFCKRLSELPEEKAAGRVYRLPTEAEWEYACRAGSKTAYFFGDDPKSIGNYAWFEGNNNDRTRPVSKKKPNDWGLYDMYGNVWEWCSDWYGDYPKGPVTDPAGLNEGTLRVLRGGSWKDTEVIARTARRGRIAPLHADNYLGFRVALSPSGSAK